jgi:hypothetical protein
VVSGLKEGEQVIIIRMENPPENSLVQITEPDKGGKLSVQRENTQNDR